MILRTAQDFGCLIKTTRKQSKLTQAQLAAASGVGIRYVRELENGKPSCQLGKALLIANMLGIKLDVILPILRDE